MEVKVKKLNDKAVMPYKATVGAAGYDLTATSVRYDVENRFIEYGTSLAFEIPPGYVGKLYARSSNSKKDVILSNSVGIVDSDYRGEVLFRFKPLQPAGVRKYEVGERIGQLIIEKLPEVTLVEATELTLTGRGEGSFGSSGK